MTNCPNCGAVITGPKCEYCDTRFEFLDTMVYVPKKNVDKLDRTIQRHLEIENELYKAKYGVLDASTRLKYLYEDAIKAMRKYNQTV